MDFQFLVSTIVVLICFFVCFQAMQAFHFEKIVKPNHVAEARLLYWILVCALTGNLAQFVFMLLHLKK